MAIETGHSVAIITLELGRAEAFQGAARGKPLVLDDEVVVGHSVALQFVTVSLPDCLTVNRWELSGNLGCGASNLVYEGETERQKNTNDQSGEQLPDEVLHICEMPILPYDVCRLRCWLELEGLAEECFVGLNCQGDDPGILFLKSDESGSGSRQVFEVLEQVIDDEVLFLDPIEPLVNYFSAAFSKCTDQLVVIKGEDHVGHEDILVFIIGLPGYLLTGIRESIAHFSLENLLNLFG